MGKSFPELGLEQQDCLAMSWIESVLYFAGLPYGPGHSIDVLLDRGLQEKVFYNGKSDFVEEPISQIGLEGIWERVLEEENMYMIMDPLGGRMSEISTAEIPFPYRRGDLDLGVNEEGNQSYSTARIWGRKYFNGNFKRLAQVKGVVDPTNFFRSEQSIPPLVGMEEEIVQLALV
ncbi:berberine bridge enzyme-like 23 [Magnolia sinica]|uniref:berberine bridge enzyme-like 23 n=1 Tax=Magnolia sinica TaxID=86752 RepID=UPI002657FD0B|nr:berberine bridge enzyme-like 23 [Magnolia sinica]